jgi:glycosyltransferase involved in cell wall biosynthesis
MRSDVFAVIPAYRCAATIGEVVAGARRHLSTVVVVDDGSGDATAEAAEAAGGVLVRLGRNRGKGHALRAGLGRALADGPRAILFLDGDGQHDTQDIPRFLEAWDAGFADLIIGARLGDSGPIPGHRYWVNYVGTRILSWMTGRELEDSQSGYRLVSAELLARLPLESEGYAVESEMLIRAAHRRARIAHVPVRTIYGAETSHFQAVRDTLRISLWSIYVKAFDEVS